MLERWARTVARRRWWVLSMTLVPILLAGLVSGSLTDRLQQGGYEVPGSESVRADNTLERAVGQQAPDLVAVYTSDDRDTLSDQDTARTLADAVADLPSAEVEQAAGWWHDPGLLSSDQRTGAIAFQLNAETDGELVEAADAVRARLVDTGEIQNAELGFTGYAALGGALQEQTEQDLLRAELISFPVLLILLLVVFGGLAAAAMPLAVGGVGIVGALGVLWVISAFNDVSIFAMNVVTLLGLGLAIDYALFIVTRFREELHARQRREGRDEDRAAVADALAVTLRTAGRTVLISGLTVAAALSGLLVFPQMMLKSVGLGGIAAVVVAAIAAITVLPALLAVLGRRVDALALPFRRRRTVTSTPEENRGWGRVARLVMRQPAIVALLVIGGLLAAGLPFLRAEFSEADASVLPADHQVRVATEQLREELPAASDDSAQLVLVGEQGRTPNERSVLALAREARHIEGIGRVLPTAAEDGVAVLTAELAHDPQGERAQQAVQQLRDLDAPENVEEILVGGPTARLIDTVDAIADNLGWMILVLASAILVLLFLAFGSILLPIKAVVISALSLTASFGAVVWIFQDGHFVTWLGTEAGPIEASMPVMMLAVLFGLSTDYELFLLSRVAEGYRSGLPPKTAVVHGLARTGPLITAAAVLLGVVIGAFALGDTSLMKLLGVGMLIAILVDATIVRGLLVPALLALFGNAAWWAPRLLARFARRVSLEGSDSREQPLDSVVEEREPVGR